MFFKFMVKIWKKNTLIMAFVQLTFKAQKPDFRIWWFYLNFQVFPNQNFKYSFSNVW